VGLEDRGSLRVVQSALEGPRSEELIRHFYDTWFTRDPSVGAHFPPDLTHQRAAFTYALRWLFGEFIAQRSAEPAAFFPESIQFWLAPPHSPPSPPVTSPDRSAELCSGTSATGSVVSECSSSRWR
jgi:hypothetical protein